MSRGPGADRARVRAPRVPPSRGVFALTLTFALALTRALSACTDSPVASPDVCAPYALPEGTKLDAPSVAFAADVAPIFREACGFSSCHGGESRPPYLGAQGVS